MFSRGNIESRIAKEEKMLQLAESYYSREKLNGHVDEALKAKAWESNIMKRICILNEMLEDSADDFLDF